MKKIFFILFLFFIIIPVNADWDTYVNNWETITANLWNTLIDKVKDISDKQSIIETNITSLEDNEAIIESNVTTVENNFSSLENTYDSNWDWIIDTVVLPYTKSQLIWKSDWTLDSSLTWNTSYFQFYNDWGTAVNYTDFKDYVQSWVTFWPSGNLQTWTKENYKFFTPLNTEVPVDQFAEYIVEWAKVGPTLWTATTWIAKEVTPSWLFFEGQTVTSSRHILHDSMWRGPFWSSTPSLIDVSFWGKKAFFFSYWWIILNWSISWSRWNYNTNFLIWFYKEGLNMNINWQPLKYHLVSQTNARRTYQQRYYRPETVTFLWATQNLTTWNIILWFSWFWREKSWCNSKRGWGRNWIITWDLYSEYRFFEINYTTWSISQIASSKYNLIPGTTGCWCGLYWQTKYNIGCPPNPYVWDVTPTLSYHTTNCQNIIWTHSWCSNKVTTVNWSNVKYDIRYVSHRSTNNSRRTRDDMMTRWKLTVIN